MFAFNSPEEFIASLQELTWPICCDSFSEEHYPICVDGCRHVFGVECLRSWVTSGRSDQNTCPNCRAAMFEISQQLPVRARSSVGATSDAPYERVISDSEYETDSEGSHYDDDEYERTERSPAENHEYNPTQDVFITVTGRLIAVSLHLLPPAFYTQGCEGFLHEQREAIWDVRRQQRDRAIAYRALTMQVMLHGDGNSMWEELVMPLIEKIANETARAFRDSNVWKL
ncbi:uncharacterized protein M421DRAFT_96253 [Didymella exigua CBS 183.55]|uniref:RING-type domain-containing protein n=1 Tax=Didymella exigua CBS 183.55 TaxID=1150837 RepID=A0A6A5RBN1_9PLEO|nr:uncharacterized protein M421DRAFT_96253 [Didymella exigua CBS 183.55]KAF1923207.1 hypothetical protein M421DRAFT_96253 [Didymella exigua CBS 183.55]